MCSVEFISFTVMEDQLNYNCNSLGLLKLLQTMRVSTETAFHVAGLYFYVKKIFDMIFELFIPAHDKGQIIILSRKKGKENMEQRNHVLLSAFIVYVK